MILHPIICPLYPIVSHISESYPMALPPIFGIETRGVHPSRRAAAPSFHRGSAGSSLAMGRMGWSDVTWSWFEAKCWELFYMPYAGEYIYISISVYCIHYIYICIWNQSVKWIRSIIKFWNGLYLPHKMSRMTFGNGWKWCVGFDSDVSWPIALLAKGNHPSTWLEHNPPFTTAILSKRNSSSPHMFTVIWIHVWGWVKTYHILHILIYFWGNKHVLTSYFRLRRVPGFLLIAVWRMTCVTGWGPWDRTCTLKIKPAASLMFSNTPLKGAAFGASVEAPELFREKDMETYGNQIISLGFLHVSFIWSTGFPKEHGRLWQEEAGSNPAIRSGLYIVIESSFCREYPNNPPSY